MSAAVNRIDVNQNWKCVAVKVRAPAYNIGRPNECVGLKEKYAKTSHHQNTSCVVVRHLNVRSVSHWSHRIIIVPPTLQTCQWRTYHRAFVWHGIPIVANFFIACIGLFLLTFVNDRRIMQGQYAWLVNQIHCNVLITVCAVAQHCCNGDELFQWEIPFLESSSSGTSEPIFK